MIYIPFPVIRICRICNKTYGYHLLKKKRNSQDGVDSLCLKCHSEQSKIRYYQKHDNILDKQHRYYESHRDERKKYDKKRSSTEKRKEYIRIYSAKYYQDNKEELRTQKKEYYLNNKNKWKYVKRELTEEQKKKRRATSVRYQRRHPEVKRRADKQYRKKHPEVKRAGEERRRGKIKNLPNTLTSKEWVYCLLYFNNRCAVCGREKSDEFSIAMDHWIALSDPKPDNPGTVAWNIIPLCHSHLLGGRGCNNTKSNLDPEKWLLKSFSREEVDQILDRLNTYFMITQNEKKRGLKIIT